MRNASTDEWILARRGPRNPVAPDRPYAFLVEKEPARGTGHNKSCAALVDVAAIFLTNRECPFRCLMCDLWKNTLTASVAAGDIPAQIRFALERLQPARHIKLYNAGNFFDPQAIPPEDYRDVADLVGSFERVIVECHPRLIGRRCWEFRDLLRRGRPRERSESDTDRLRGSVRQDSSLEVAMGLETVHPEVLARLNKQMTLEDYSRAVAALVREGVAVRAFILVRPPFLSEDEGLHWARRSLDFAFAAGVECCCLIPTRSGNGAMEELARQGQFAAPSLETLAQALEYGLSLRAGRVMVDLWDIRTASVTEAALVNRLTVMNLTQQSGR